MPDARPPSGREKRTVKVIAYVRESTRRALELEARRQDRTLSWLIDRAVRRLLAEGDVAGAGGPSSLRT